MIIDLRSDTVTRPSAEMMKAMCSAEVGDDVLGDDPTVRQLEKKVAGIFGKDAALFCPSGTMANQIAIRVHTRPGDEIICDESAHLFNFEGGGVAANSGVQVRYIFGDRGRFTSEQALAAINPNNEHYARTRVITIENTCNKSGGSIWNIADIQALSKLCRIKRLAFHLDGARLFNATVETGSSHLLYGAMFDSISLCLSKGLGAPVGSLIIGNNDFIYQAKRVRKILGGGMRQAGFLAAAGIFALDNNIERLKEDNQRAKNIESILESLDFVDEILPVESNIVIFKLSDNYPQNIFLKNLEDKGILATSFGPQIIRFVTHLDFTDEMLEQFEKSIRDLKIPVNENM